MPLDRIPLRPEGTSIQVEVAADLEECSLKSSLPDQWADARSQYRICQVADSANLLDADGNSPAQQLVMEPLHRQVLAFPVHDYLHFFPLPCLCPVAPRIPDSKSPFLLFEGYGLLNNNRRTPPNNKFCNKDTHNTGALSHDIKTTQYPTPATSNPAIPTTANRSISLGEIEGSKIAFLGLPGDILTRTTFPG